MSGDPLEDALDGWMADAWPPGYQDPPWSTKREFLEVVLPARRRVLIRSLNEKMAPVLPEGFRFEWE